MKFKIREVTYTNGNVLYYPMVKKRFWGWFYIRNTLDGLEITKKAIIGNNLAQASKCIVTYKKDLKKAKPIIRDILID